MGFIRKNKRVLVLDASLQARQILTELIGNIEGFAVLAAVGNPVAAAQILVREHPDILILDVVLPVMDGPTFIHKVMHLHPLPILVMGHHAGKNSAVAQASLELGAAEYLQWPTLEVAKKNKSFLQELRQKLQECLLVKTRSLALDVSTKRMATAVPAQGKTAITNIATTLSTISGSTPGQIPTTTNSQSSPNKIHQRYSVKVIGVGASTGGTSALVDFVRGLSEKMPAIVIVQHMPKGFTKSFAQRLNNECNLKVKEAEDGDELYDGHIYLAPGGMQMEVKRGYGKYVLSIQPSPPVNHHCPSVDVLFKSLSQSVGSNAIGVMLTGMRSDGAQGMLHMKEAGSFNIAQDEKTSTVWGMPKAAIDCGGVDLVRPLQLIPEELAKFLAQERR